MSNTADVKGGKPIAASSQSISGVNAINPLVTFYDTHGRKREVLYFYFVPDTTPDCMQLYIKHLSTLWRTNVPTHIHFSAIIILSHEESVSLRILCSQHFNMRSKRSVFIIRMLRFPRVIVIFSIVMISKYAEAVCPKFRRRYAVIIRVLHNRTRPMRYNYIDCNLLKKYCER
jgi:hypothetical protein